MKENLDTQQLRALCKLYSTTESTKDKSIKEIVTHWGPDAIELLHLDEYSDWTLRSTIKVASKIGINEADRLLGPIFSRRLRLNKRGGGSIRAITNADWQDLVSVMDSDEAKATILQIPVLTDEEQLRLGITEPLSIFKDRISASASSYHRRRLRESNQHQARIDNTDEQEQRAGGIQTAKRVIYEWIH